jgi:hypothetical protein
VVHDGRLAAVGDDELLGQVDGDPEVVDHGGAFERPPKGRRRRWR